MINLKYYLVSFDRCDHYAVSKLTPEERNDVICYAVNPAVFKLISAPIKRVNEWEFKWYSNRYQVLQYYEYGTIVHCVKNPELLEGLTHVGLLHYDVFFPPNSVNDIKKELEIEPNVIYYNTLRQNNQLFFTQDQLKHIVEFMNKKLAMNMDANKIWNSEWVSEALSITPINIYKKFGEYILSSQHEIEAILNGNKWGIMDYVKHRPCGFMERMWGIYLISLDLPLKKMPIIHDWDRYQHAHLKDKENFLKKF